MNKLFTRTLLWFIATVVLTFVAMIIATAIDMNPEDRQRPPYGAMLALQFSEARFAYEAGGPRALDQVLRRFRQVTNTQAVLTDAFARDLVTGENRSDLIEAIQSRPARPFLWRGNAVIGRISRDRQYMFFLIVQRGNWLRWFLQPEVHLTMLVVLAILSYAFARHLTNPVMRLQKAVDCFGRGDFSARVRTDRKDEIGDLARTFDQMADRIETLMTAERRLLLDISHELRSPLARLTVALELARSDLGDSKHLDRIQKDIERLNALVGELLQVTRAEGDAARMRFEQLDLTALLDSVVQDARLEAEARGCRIDWPGAQPTPFQGDPELLRRAIENVLRNATRYAPPDTAINVNFTKSSKNATVTVRDRGPGVPEPDLVRIFDPFYRVGTHRDRSSGGAGLGLAIARRAIELHHGRVTARNANPGLAIEIELMASGLQKTDA